MRHLPDSTYFHSNSYIYTEVDATLKIPLRDTAQENVERLLRFVQGSLGEAEGGVRIMLANVLNLVEPAADELSS